MTEKRENWKRKGQRKEKDKGKKKRDRASDCTAQLAHNILSLGGWWAQGAGPWLRVTMPARRALPKKENAGRSMFILYPSRYLSLYLSKIFLSLILHVCLCVRTCGHVLFFMSCLPLNLVFIVAPTLCLSIRLSVPTTFSSRFRAISVCLSLSVSLSVCLRLPCWSACPPVQLCCVQVSNHSTVCVAVQSIAQWLLPRTSTLSSTSLWFQVTPGRWTIQRLL